MLFGCALKKCSRFINIKLTQARGIGMVEVLIAAGMVAGISIAVMKLGQEGAKVSKTSSTKRDIDYLHQRIADSIASTDGCYQTFVASYTTNPAIGVFLNNTSNAQHVNPTPLATMPPIKNKFGSMNIIADGGSFGGNTGRDWQVSYTLALTSTTPVAGYYPARADFTYNYIAQAKINGGKSLRSRYI